MRISLFGMLLQAFVFLAFTDDAPAAESGINGVCVIFVSPGCNAENAGTRESRM